MDLLSKVSPLIKEYPDVEITNIDATGREQYRAAYFFDRRFTRRGNVFLELWQAERDNKLIFIWNRELTTREENEEMDRNRRPTSTRGTLYRYGMTEGEMLSYIRSKLDLYYKKHNLEKKESLCKDEVSEGTSDLKLKKYVFYKMIDPDKNVSVVRNTENGMDYVQKEYKLFNQNVFERLKNASIKGVPRIIECEKVGNKLVTIEEFIKGKNLSEIMEQDGTFDEEEMLHIALQLCDTLEALHSMNPPMIHRDIKPSNIMLKKTGEVILIDFNASREYRQGYTQDTVLFGTQNFAAPEQLMGFGDSDARTDIFGLGATLSYLLTKMPINQLVAPGKFSGIFSKCISMDKKDRYQSIAEFRKALLEA